ncbi:MAG: TMEM175 family protein, partial [Enterococcus viikkiensis]
MTKSRLEAFTDGVVAIVLTVLVLNIQIPDAPSLASLKAITNILFAYVVSFIFVAVIW